MTPNHACKKGGDADGGRAPAAGYATRRHSKSRCALSMTCTECTALSGDHRYRYVECCSSSKGAGALAHATGPKDALRVLGKGEDVKKQVEFIDRRERRLALRVAGHAGVPAAKGGVGFLDLKPPSAAGTHTYTHTQNTHTYHIYMYTCIPVCV